MLPCGAPPRPAVWRPKGPRLMSLRFPSAPQMKVDPNNAADQEPSDCERDNVPKIQVEPRPMNSHFRGGQTQIHYNRRSDRQRRGATNTAKTDIRKNTIRTAI